jgi:hypothetical protein
MRLRRIQVESIGLAIIFWPRAITYRDIAASAVIDRHIAHSRRHFDVLEDCFFDHASAANPFWLRRLNHWASIDPA